MDERIATALARGRAQLRAGKRAAAVATWKEALRVAYETQNHAAAFVLSKNLGDATLETSGSVDTAVGYFDYALQLLEGCGLHDDYAFYPPLENVVQYIRRRRRRARRVTLEAPPLVVESKIRAVSTDRTSDLVASGAHTVDEPSQVCTTCEQPGSRENPIVVDDADGCPYCKSCFDAYYAEAEEDEETPSADLDSVDGALEEDDDAREEAESQNGVSSGFVAVEAEDRFESSDVDPVEKIEPVAEKGAHIDMQSPDSIELDVFTAKIGQLELDEPAYGAADSFNAGSRGMEITNSPPIVDDQSTLTPTPVTRYVYSIQQLKSLRVLDLPCPADVESSAVFMAKGSEQPVNNRPSSARTKKQQGKTVKRSSTDTNPPSHAEDAKTLLTASLLPSLAECDAVRSKLDSMPSPLQLASAFFDGVRENPAPTADSFVTQRQLFSRSC